VGFLLGEDTCLFEDDDKSVHSSPDGDDVHAGFEMDENVDMLADKIVKELIDAEEKEVNDDEQDKSVNLETTEPIVGHAVKKPVGSVTVNPKDVSKVVASSTNDVDASALDGVLGAQPFNVSP